MNVEEADFVFLKERTESTAGNLSVQLDKSVLHRLSNRKVVLLLIVYVRNSQIILLNLRN